MELIFVLQLLYILNNYLYFCPSIWRWPDGPVSLLNKF